MQSCKKRPLYYWLGAAQTRLGPAKSARKQLQQQKLFFETFSRQAVRAPAPHSYCSRAQELVCTALTWHDSGPGLYITQPVLHGIANRQKAGAQFNLQKLWPASREGDKSRTPLTTLALWRDISNLPWISLPRSSPNNLQPCKQLSTAAAAVVCWRTANSCDLRPFCSNGAIKCDISEIQIQKCSCNVFPWSPCPPSRAKHLNCFLTTKLCTS